jgi:hypothetical protein
MDQQQTNNQDDANNAMSAAMHPDSMPHFDQQQAFMDQHQQFGADAMMGLMAGQGFMPDPSLAGGMPMDGSMLMPFMLANGNATLQMPTNGISPGKHPVFLSHHSVMAM